MKGWRLTKGNDIGIQVGQSHCRHGRCVRQKGVREEREPNTNPNIDSKNRSKKKQAEQNESKPNSSRTSRATVRKSRQDDTFIRIDTILSA